MTVFNPAPARPRSVMTTTMPQIRHSTSFRLEGDTQQITAARLLQLFNEARAAVGTALVGEAGCGAGYDQLHIDNWEIADVSRGDHVIISARPIAATPRRHRVHYVAECVKDGQPSHARPCVLAEAVGWTLSPNASWCTDAEGVPPQAPVEWVAVTAIAGEPPSGVDGA